MPIMLVNDTKSYLSKYVNLEENTCYKYFYFVLLLILYFSFNCTVQIAFSVKV